MRRWQQKRHFKKMWTYILSAFIAIIPTHFLFQKQVKPLALNCKDPFPSSEREINFGPSLFKSSIKEIKEKVCCTCKVVVLPRKPIAFLTTSSLSSRYRSVRYLITNMADLLEGTFLVLASVKKRYRKIDRCSTKVLAEMPPYKSKW